MVIQPVCIWSGSDLAWITVGAAIYELVEDEDVNSARDCADEPGHPVELLQREILPQCSGCVVCFWNPLFARMIRCFFHVRGVIGVHFSLNVEMMLELIRVVLHILLFGGQTGDARELARVVPFMGCV